MSRVALYVLQLRLHKLTIGVLWCNRADADSVYRQDKLNHINNSKPSTKCWIVSNSAGIMKLVPYPGFTIACRSCAQRRQHASHPCRCMTMCSHACSHGVEGCPEHKTGRRPPRLSRHKLPALVPGPASVNRIITCMLAAKQYHESPILFSVLPILDWRSFFLSPSMSDSNRHKTEEMSKLAPSLKALINAPFARPGPCAAPAKIRDVYTAIAEDAASKNLGLKPWLTISV